jgi:hypothetical protein
LVPSWGANALNSEPVAPGRRRALLSVESEKCIFPEPLKHFGSGRDFSVRLRFAWH